MDAVLNSLAELIKQNYWLAPLIALVAGIVTSFTPCSLSTIPMVLAYVGANSGGNTKRAFGLSLTMALGMALTFAIFGSAASVIGHFMHHAGRWWTIFLGVLMILMALQTWEVIHIIPHVHMEGKISKKGYMGAVFAGMLSGVFASHCATPVMIALLAMVARAGRSTLWGIFLMALYAVGHSVLLLAAGSSYGLVESFIENPKYASASNIIRKVLGGVILLIGVLSLLVKI